MKKLHKIIIIISIVLLSFPIITSAENTSEKQVELTRNENGNLLIGKKFVIDRTLHKENPELVYLKFSIGYNAKKHEVMPYVVVYYESQTRNPAASPEYLWDGFDFVQVSNIIPNKTIYLFVFKSYHWIMYMKHGLHGFLHFSDIGEVHIDVPPWIFREINEAFEIISEIEKENLLKENH